MLFQSKSIKHKFLTAVATTSFITSLITTTLIGIFDWGEHKTRWINDMGNQALLLGRACIPALQFNDKELATKNLALLEVRPRIHSAALYDANGTIYANFRGSKYFTKLPLNFKNNTAYVNGDELTISREINQNGDLVGYMLITAEYGLNKRLATYFGILLVIGVLALIISQFIARWLHDQIAQPVEEIAGLAKEVVEKRDYSLRAQKTTDDEVGYLVNAFNTMLDEIEKGNEAQQKSHDLLETKVMERTEELKKSQFALLQSQKLEAVGKLTGGIAHDFNNILQVIGSNLEILLMKFSSGLPPKDRIESALAAVDRGAKLSSQLLAFARRQPLQPVPTNLNNLTKSMDDLLRRALGESIEIEIIHGGALWNVLVDRNQIENVILNLSINARDAMNNNGHLTIETSNVMLDDLYAESNDEIKAGQYVLLAISDTGCGMPQDVIERAFEPFFTTKGEGKGTGLGLSMAYGLVKQSGGNIKIYSEVDHGTTIKIYLPRIHLMEPEIPINTNANIQGGSESILVVEDDISVQTAVADILKGLGYSVQIASDAQSALDIIEKGQQFDVLFTDVVMPGTLKSVELAKLAKTILPDIAVLFTSGYTQNAIVHGGKLDIGVELINKPYRHGDLAKKMRSVIEKAKNEKNLRTKSLNDKKDKITPTPLKILVVEDNLEAQASLCELLTMLDYQALGVSTAEEALKQIHLFDVLLTDVNLPGMSGIELVKQTNLLAPSMPLIISSGMDISIDLSFDVLILPKPFSMKIMTEILGRAKNLITLR